MIPVWRLTRNRYTRRIYEALDAAGVTATRMLEYRTAVADVPERTADDVGGPTPVSLVAGPAGTERHDDFSFDFSVPVAPYDREWVILAVAGDEAVGRALVSAGLEPTVDVLGTSMSFEGAYVRRVFVDRSWRGRGIATALVREAVTVGSREFGATTAYALIAADNKPSRWVFEANGFGPVRRHDYARLFGREWRRTVPVSR